MQLSEVNTEQSMSKVKRVQVPYRKLRKGQVLRIGQLSDPFIFTKFVMVLQFWIFRHLAETPAAGGLKKNSSVFSAI